MGVCCHVGLQQIIMGSRKKNYQQVEKKKDDVNTSQYPAENLLLATT